MMTVGSRMNVVMSYRNNMGNGMVSSENGK